MQAATALTDAKDATVAATQLASGVRKKLCDAPAALVLFAAPTFDHQKLLNGLNDEFPSAIIVGASSAGEFTNDHVGQDATCLLALGGPDVRFGSGIGRNLKSDVPGAARKLSATFRGTAETKFSHRTAMVMADALAGHADTLVDELILATSGLYSFFGGGAGDNARFERTTVFHGREVLTDAAVALEIVSEKPLGIGAMHGWEPKSEPLRVTEAHGMSLISLNGFPAVEAFISYAEQTGQHIDRTAPIPFFLQNILGIRTGSGHRLRVPLAIGQDGSVLCAAEIPVGAIVHIMASSEASSIESARRAAESALVALQGHRPTAALFFDCVATRLRLGNGFGREINALRETLSDVELTGCNTHGQIVRADGQFQGFHNCTAVVCVFPE
jgi:hypothetical protein